MIKHTIIDKKLENGVGLFIINTPSTEMAKLSISVRDGFGYSNKRIFELPHLLEHLAFEGNEFFPDSSVLVKKIESMGAYQNAYTTTNQINYFYDAPYVNIVPVVELALQQFSKPIFTEDSLRQEKQVVLRELEGKMDQDFFRINTKIDTLLYPNLYPDIKHRLDSVSAITREDVVRYYHQGHYASNIRVMLAGNINAKTQGMIEELILKLIPSSPKKQKNKLVFDFDHNKFDKVFYLDAIRPNQAALVMNFYWNKDDFRERMIMGLVSSMLSGGLGSIFFQKVRKAGLTYGTDTFFEWSNSLAEFAIYDQTQSTDMIKLLDMILSTTQDFCRGDFNIDDIERSKQQTFASIKSRLDSASGIMSLYANRYSEDLPLITPKEKLDIINSITKDEIINVAREYLFKNYIIGFALKDKKDNDSLKLVLNKYFSK